MWTALNPSYNAHIFTDVDFAGAAATQIEFNTLSYASVATFTYYMVRTE